MPETFKVAGVTFENDDGSKRQDFITGLRPDMPVRFWHDGANFYDQNAVAVSVHNRQIGYVPKDVRDKIGIDALVNKLDATVMEITGYGRGTRGVIVQM